MHLWWEAVQGLQLSEVEATIEVVTPPSTPDLYFWALQVSFVDARRIAGAGHFGLQWHPDFPGSRAINWGGYADDWAGGGELYGSRSELPSAVGNPNTRDFEWREGRAYRLRVHRVTDADPLPGDKCRWRAEVADLDEGSTTLVRDLFAPGDVLGRPVVWSEVFADCDARSATVRWSDFVVRTYDGRGLAPAKARISYQNYRDGGCTNTNQYFDGKGVIQETNAERRTRDNTLVATGA